MDCYLVGIRKKNEDNQGYTLLLSKSELADLLLHIDDDQYEVAELLKTFTEKAESILPFCKVDKKLETGDEQKENS